MNAIFKIQIYRDLTGWVFDDESRDLVKEPFVFGMPTIINHYVKDNKANIIFSVHPLPEFDCLLEHEKDEVGGAWYNDKKINKRGWLCSATKLYLGMNMPKKIYIKFEKVD